MSGRPLWVLLVLLPVVQCEQGQQGVYVTLEEVVHTQEQTLLRDPPSTRQVTVDRSAGATPVGMDLFEPRHS